MNCICCKNSLKICLPICSNEAVTLVTSEIAALDGLHTLELDYLGTALTFEQVQTVGQPISFSFLPHELNEDYCYLGKIFDINKNVINFGTNNEYDCIQICTKFKQ